MVNPPVKSGLVCIGWMAKVTGSRIILSLVGEAYLTIYNI